eukprot:507005_1
MAGQNTAATHMAMCCFALCDVAISLTFGITKSNDILNLARDAIIVARCSKYWNIDICKEDQVFEKEYELTNTQRMEQRKQREHGNAFKMMLELNTAYYAYYFVRGICLLLKNRNSKAHFTSSIFIPTVKSYQALFWFHTSEPTVKSYLHVLFWFHFPQLISRLVPTISEYHQHKYDNALLGGVQVAAYGVALFKLKQIMCARIRCTLRMNDILNSITNRAKKTKTTMALGGSFAWVSWLLYFTLKLMVDLAYITHTSTPLKLMLTNIIFLTN